MKKYHFKINESGYHKFAKQQLSEWVGGEMEQPFYIDGEIAFVPDITCKDNGIVTRLYEVVYSHPIPGIKLGRIQMWSYFNNTEFSVYEVSHDWILKQTEKPDRIVCIDYYDIDCKAKDVV